jgi:uroporphyrinogen-III synthase
MRVIVTRPAAQARDWVPRLQALGVDAVSLPLIGIEPARDPQAVRLAWASLADLRLVMFVSANAVAHFFDLRPQGQDWPTALWAGSTGPGTSAALREAGVPAQRIAEPDGSGPFDTESLWRRIEHWTWAGARVLVVRGDGGRDWLAERLRSAGAEVAFLAAYQRVSPVLEGDAAALLQAALDDPAAHCWHFSSSESIDHLVRLRPAVGWSAACALATHPRIGEAARRAGFGAVALVGVHPEDVAARMKSSASAGPASPDR